MINVLQNRLTDNHQSVKVMQGSKMKAGISQYPYNDRETVVLSPKISQVQNSEIKINVQKIDERSLRSLSL